MLKQSDYELHEEYERYLETLGQDAYRPTFDQWYDGIYTPVSNDYYIPAEERKFKWLTDGGKAVIRKRPVSSVLGAIALGGVGASLLGEKAQLAAEGLLGLLRLFGL